MKLKQFNFSSYSLDQQSEHIQIRLLNILPFMLLQAYAVLRGEEVIPKLTFC